MAKVEKSLLGAVMGSTSKTKGPAKVSRVEVEPSDNGGFTVTTHYRSSSRIDGPSEYREPVRSVFTDSDKMSAYICKQLGC